MGDLLTIQTLFYDMFVTYSLGSPILAMIVVFGMLYAFMALKGFANSTTIFILAFAGLTLGALVFPSVAGMIFIAVIAIILFLFVVGLWSR